MHDITGNGRTTSHDTTIRHRYLGYIMADKSNIL